jgi:diguanylate cyclase (GGDEF)-like protein
VRGSACLLAGGLFWGLVGVVPELLVILVANGMQFLGFGLLWAGTREFCDRPRSLLPIGLGLLPFLAGLFWFATAMPSTHARVVVFGLGIAPWCLAIAWSCFRHPPAQLRSTVWIAGAAFLVHGVFQLLRMFLPQEGTSTVDLLRPGWPQVAWALEIYVSSMATMLALVSLLAHRLMVDLAQAARTDALTGILNRRALEEDGEKAAVLCAGMQLPCAVLLFDLDHFKQINDAHGHLAGDAALRHFARLIGPTLRRSDIFGRYGGEEFVAVMPGAGAEEARAAAERFRKVVMDHPPGVDGGTIPLTVSIGVSWGEGERLDALVSRADDALYRAKGDGRNRVIEAAA